MASPAYFNSMSLPSSRPLIPSLQAYAQDLREPHSAETQKIARCGLSILACLQCVSQQLLEYLDGIQRGVQESRTHIAGEVVLVSLLRLAEDHVNSVAFQGVAACWLQLYADASLMLGYCAYITSVCEPPWSHIVGRLDKALIVCGTSCGNRRLWILHIIRSIQHPAADPADDCRFPDNNRAIQFAKQTREVERESRDSLSGFAARVIPCSTIPPSLAEYMEGRCKNPFVIRGCLYTDSEICLRWPALDHWSSEAYLLRTVGSKRVVPVEIGKAYDDPDWSQRLLPFETFLRKIGFTDDHHDPSSVFSSSACEMKPVYLAQHALFVQFPELENDIRLPDYVWSEIPAEMPNPPISPAQDSAPRAPLINVWLGRGDTGVLSPAHTDPHYNCFAQIVGQKRVWVAPPSVGPYMYSYGQPHLEDTTDQKPTLAEHYMANTSTVPIFRDTSVASSESTASEFPLFWRHVYPLAQEVILRPGDLLVLPKGWWHAMQTMGDGPSWSVSMWY